MGMVGPFDLVPSGIDPGDPPPRASSGRPPRRPPSPSPSPTLGPGVAEAVPPPERGTVSVPPTRLAIGPPSWPRTRSTVGLFEDRTGLPSGSIRSFVPFPGAGKGGGNQREVHRCGCAWPSRSTTRARPHLAERGRGKGAGTGGGTTGNAGGKNAREEGPCTP
eukprot:scaffold1554_cov332-Pavlova_lutheri.AAC.5